MSWGDMHWQQRLDLMNVSGIDEATGDTSQFNPGMALDTATMPWSGASQDQMKQLQQLRDQVQMYKDMNQHPGGSMTDDVFKFLKGVGEVVSIGDPVFKALAYPYKKLSTDVIDPVLQAQSLAFNHDWQKQNGTANPFSTFFDWDTWHHAHELAKTESLGQRFAKNVQMAGEWAQHPGELGQWSDAADKMAGKGVYFNVGSGVADFASTVFLDPLMVAGKVTKTARVLKTTSEVNTVLKRARATGGDFDTVMNSDAVMRLMKWTDNKSASQIYQHPIFKSSAQGGQIASLLANADHADKSLILRLAWGDRNALNELQTKAPDILAEYKRLKGDVAFNTIKADMGPQLPPTLAAMRAAESKKLLDTYGKQNAMTLKLARTEKMRDPMQFAEHAPQTPLAAADALHSPFNAMYEQAGAPLITSATWRSPEQMAAGIEHLERVQGQAKILAEREYPNGPNGAFPTEGKAATMPSLNQMAKGVTSPSGKTLQDLRGEARANAGVAPPNYGTHDFTKAQKFLQTTLGKANFDGRVSADVRAYGLGQKSVYDVTNAMKNNPAFSRLTDADLAHYQSLLDEVVHPAPRKIKFWSPDELAAADGKTATPRGAQFIRTGTRRVRQSDGTYKEVIDQSRTQGTRVGTGKNSGVIGGVTVGKATQMSLLPNMTDEAGTPVNTLAKLADVAGKPEVPMEHLPPRRPEPLFDYNPADVDYYAQKMTGQMDLATYDNADELAALERKWGFYKELRDRSEVAANLPGDSGIFNKLALMPKNGPYTLPAYRNAYARLAESKAARSYQKGAGYSRPRNFREGVSAIGANSSVVRRYGWFATPVKVVMASGRSVSHAIRDTGTPISYNPNEPESWRDVDKWLSKVVNYDPAKREEHVNTLMGLTDEGIKLDHVRNIEADVMAHMMRQNGITDDLMLKDVIAKTMGKRKAVMDQMASNVRTYKAGNADPTVNFLDGDGTPVSIRPELASQLLNEHPLMPLDQLETAFKRNRHWLRAKHVAITDPIMDMSTMLHRVWKLSVLGHFGYMPRTLSDEVLVSMAALGGASIMAKGAEGAANFSKNLGTHTFNGFKRVANVPSVLRRDPLKYEYGTPKNRIGQSPVDVGGFKARGVFQGPRGAIYRGLTGVEQRAQYELEAKSLEHLRVSSNYGELNPKNEASHIPAWTHALNNQLGRDPLAVRFMQGAPLKDAVDWLTKNPTGIKYANRMKYVIGNEEEHARNVLHFVNEYTVGDPNLAKKAAKRHVTSADLQKIDMNDRPQVHGGQLDYALGTGDIGGFMNRLMDSFYHVANELPTNTLVRHPVADLYYHRRLRELVASSRAQGFEPSMHPEHLYQMEDIARSWTIKQMKDLYKDHLFNSPQNALKFIFPFFGAWRGSIARWANMIGEDPSVLSRINQGWQGLGKPFELQDSNGNPVDPNKPHGLGTDAQMVVRAPMALVKALGYAGVAPARRIGLKTFNTWLQGDPWWNPGYGPAVTIPLSEVIKGDLGGGPKPYLADNPLVKQALPYGARSIGELAAPAPWQRVISAMSGDSEGNAAMESTKISIMKMEMTRYARGERKQMPTAEEINSKSHSLMWLRAAESWFSPVSTKPVVYGTDAKGNPWPKGWQFLADKFRAYRSSTPNAEGIIDGRAGEDKFFQEFPEAWIYMQSTSKNVSGIPANQASWDKSERVKDLMTKAPDIFASVAGITDKDKNGFNRGVYDAQMHQDFNPATGQHSREGNNVASFMTDATVNQGWREYAKSMDIVKIIEGQRGIDPVFGTTPDDLQEFKRQMVADLKKRYPEWGDAYDGGSSSGKMRKVLEQARIVTKDPHLMADRQRTDLTTLRDYVTTRDWFVARLKERNDAGGSATLGANSNNDLQEAWKNVRNYFDQNTKFAELWLNRYFANDYIQESK